MKKKLRIVCRDKETLITEIIEANQEYIFRKDGSFTNDVKRTLKNALKDQGSFHIEETTLPED